MCCGRQSGLMNAVYMPKTLHEYKGCYFTYEVCPMGHGLSNGRANDISLKDNKAQSIYTSYAYDCSRLQHNTF